jgi:nucleoside-diphosphate-sugar epimerase
VGRPTPTLRVPEWSLPLAAVGVRIGRFFFGNKIPMDENQVILSGATIYADSRKAKEALNFPQTPFETTVQSTFDWYNKHGFI